MNRRSRLASLDSEHSLQIIPTTTNYGLQLVDLQHGVGNIGNDIIVILFTEFDSKFAIFAPGRLLRVENIA